MTPHLRGRGQAKLEREAPALVDEALVAHTMVPRAAFSAPWWKRCCVLERGQRSFGVWWTLRLFECAQSLHGFLAL